MHISDIGVQNFRKLKNTFIDLNRERTLLVGANNSGKTSCIDALQLFLTEKKNEFAATDFTISNWSELIEIGEKCLISSGSIEEERNSFYNLLPSIDLWLEVSLDEIHLVDHILPSLKWDGGKLGIRFRFEPREYEKLIEEYVKTKNEAVNLIKKIRDKKTKVEDGDKEEFSLWPKNLKEFLEDKNNLGKHFCIKSYPLNPKAIELENYLPEELDQEVESYESDPLRGLIKVDVINAQRGFSDPKTNSVVMQNGGGELKTLSHQFREYYASHIDPSNNPNEEDVEALSAIDQAQSAFNDKIKNGFKSPLKELEKIGYPGFTDPKITLSCKVNPIDGLNHSSAIQFDVIKLDESYDLKLPEKYNGLGYQNLISMVFRLMRYRDRWMRVGKVSIESREKLNRIEPIHLVLIEEPEAHLHAQVKQVFIRKAYEVLRNHPDLKKSKKFATQLIVSTHSSHITHEVEYSDLRYFKRFIPDEKVGVPYSKMVSMGNVFGTKDKTRRFVSRYLKSVHSDLFFADGIILVEGAAERMLMPHFIKNNFKELTECYLTILEVGGAHAHTLKPIIEKIGVPTLIITDLDSQDSNGKSTLPLIGGGQLTNNDTLKNWCPEVTHIDCLARLPSTKKVRGNVRVSYQKLEQISFNGEIIGVVPYTFEDSLVFENLEVFKDFGGKGMAKKFYECIRDEQSSEFQTVFFDIIKSNSKKADFALEVLYNIPPENLNTPNYIQEGLRWLFNELKSENLKKITKESKGCENE